MKARNLRVNLFQECTMSQSNTPVWLITGCSTGLGRALATLIVKRGWRAIVTARDASSIEDIVSGVEDRTLALTLDVTKQGRPR
jgi:NADP-dependent 3-hydroxy acid dehydrogenase YdfG